MNLHRRTLVLAAAATLACARADKLTLALNPTLGKSPFDPAGTPAPVLQRLNAEINKALALPDLRARLITSDNLPAGGSAADFARQIATESEHDARFIKAANIRVGPFAQRSRRLALPDRHFVARPATPRRCAWRLRLLIPAAQPHPEGLQPCAPTPTLPFVFSRSSWPPPALRWRCLPPTPPRRAFAR